MKYLSTIENFFLDELKGKELEDFILELKSNEDLKNEFEIYERALDFAKTQETRIIKDIKKLKDFEFNTRHLFDIKKYGNKQSLNEGEKRISEILQSEDNEINKNKKRFLVFKSAAITILIIGFTISALLFCPRYKNDEDLFIKFYSPYSHSINTRSLNLTYSKSVKDGLMFYDKGDYTKALSNFKDVPDSLVYNSELCIVIGVCFIENKSYNSAIQTFGNIGPNSLLYTTSLWYKGLCYLKINDNRDAQVAFKKVESFEPYYQSQSKKILKYLKH